MVDKYVKKKEVYIYADDDLLVHNLEEVGGLVESSGVEDAGKIPALDPTGKLDESLLPENGGAIWGGITGILSDQEDLQEALDGKDPLGAGEAAVAEHEGTYDHTEIHPATKVFHDDLELDADTVDGFHASELGGVDILACQVFS